MRPSTHCIRLQILGSFLLFLVTYAPSHPANAHVLTEQALLPPTFYRLEGLSSLLFFGIKSQLCRFPPCVKSPGTFGISSCTPTKISLLNLFFSFAANNLFGNLQLLKSQPTTSWRTSCFSKVPLYPLTGSMNQNSPAVCSCTPCPFSLKTLCQANQTVTIKYLLHKYDFNTGLVTSTKILWCYLPSKQYPYLLHSDMDPPHLLPNTPLSSICHCLHAPVPPVNPPCHKHLLVNTSQVGSSTLAPEAACLSLHFYF